MHINNTTHRKASEFIDQRMEVDPGGFIYFRDLQSEFAEYVQDKDGLVPPCPWEVYLLMYELQSRRLCTDIELRGPDLIVPDFRWKTAF